jgi:hypothetical protein
MVLSTPPSVVMWGLLSTVCVCRPDLESIGLSSIALLGPPPGNPHYMMAQEESYLSQVLRAERSGGNEIDEATAVDSSEPRTMFNNKDISLLQYEKSKSRGDGSINPASKAVYNNFVTVSAEADLILTEIQKLNEAIQKEALKLNDTKAIEERLYAMMVRLDMRTDGSPGYMNILPTIRYGNARARLEQKIARARRQSHDLVSNIEGLEDDYDYKVE